MEVNKLHRFGEFVGVGDKEFQGSRGVNLFNFAQN
jgi:hypothetical protein